MVSPNFLKSLGVAENYHLTILIFIQYSRLMIRLKWGINKGKKEKDAFLLCIVRVVSSVLPCQFLSVYLILIHWDCSEVYKQRAEQGGDLRSCQSPVTPHTVGKELLPNDKIAVKESESSPSPCFWFLLEPAKFQKVLNMSVHRI